MLKPRVRETNIAFSSSLVALPVYPSQSRSDDGLLPVKIRIDTHEVFLLWHFSVLHTLTVLCREPEYMSLCVISTDSDHHCIGLLDFKSQLTYAGTDVAVIPPTLLVDVLGHLRISSALFFNEQCYQDGQG